MYGGEQQWRDSSRWYDSYLTADRVARYLGDAEGSLAADFFGAQPDAGGRRWSLAEIYTYLDARGGDERIPRLFPLSDERGPARLLHTSHVVIAELDAEFVVHSWDPRDGRGAIAVGYPVRDSEGAKGKRAADALLGLTGASAVAILCGGDAPIRPGYETPQPGVWVADGRLSHAMDTVSICTERFGWSELNHLLGTSLPYWPYGLRDREAMLAWRPGDRPTEITVGTKEYDPQALGKALAAVHTPVVEDVVGRLSHRMQKLIWEVSACDPTSEGYRYADLPGLNVAAVPAHIPAPAPVSTGEVTLLLHQRAPDAQLSAAVDFEAIPMRGVVNAVRRVDLTGPLAEAWVARLVEAPVPDELGFRLLEREFDGAAGLIEYLVHPNLPDCWVACQGETIVHTIGSVVPATGMAARVYMTEKGGFFRDTSGAIWPVPVASWPGENTTIELARAVILLFIDAGANLDEFDGFEPPEFIVERVRQSEGRPLHFTYPHN